MPEWQPEERERILLNHMELLSRVIQLIMNWKMEVNHFQDLFNSICLSAFVENKYHGILAVSRIGEMGCSWFLLFPDFFCEVTPQFALLCWRLFHYSLKWILMVTNHVMTLWIKKLKQYFLFVFVFVKSGYEDKAGQWKFEYPVLKHSIFGLDCLV